jgi:hypothetical protein
MEALQASALPLGHATKKDEKNLTIQGVVFNLFYLVSSFF